MPRAIRTHTLPFHIAVHTTRSPRVWQAAITEDSDLLAYGCERTLFKMDLASASASLVVWSELQYAQDPKSARVRHLFDGDAG